MLWGHTVVTLCGSTRFSDAYREALLRETLANKMVFTIGCDMKSDEELFKNLDEEEKKRLKTRLDILHLHKIIVSDEILVLNVDGYIGESTKNEIEWAKKHGVTVRYLSQEKEK